jgi:mono/diheme cytochrome c family protein
MLLALVFLAAAPRAVAQDGAAVYAQYCASCHQPDGAGLAGVFPPLANHVGDLYSQEGGRRYLVDAIVFGVQGRIVVDGQTYDGVMPSWFQLSDGEITAVLNHVMTAWGDVESVDEFEPYSDADVATSRRGALTPQRVLERRPAASDDDAGVALDLPLASFTEAQVQRILPTYERLCAECHGDSYDGGLIGGPPLRGAVFLQRWGGRSVAPLFAYTSSQMPQGGPGTLSSQQYADLIALMLRANGHEAGDVELRGDPEALEEVGVRAP